MNTKQGAILATVVLLGFTSVATADEKEIVSSLTLEQLVGDAMRENPQLKSMRAKWEAMKERPAQERTLPNPMLTYSGMDMIDGGTWPDTQEKRVMVQQEFPWFGKLGLKGKVAEKDAESMQREYEAMQREVIMMVKESYFDLYATQRALSITRAEEDVLKQMQKIAEAKYGVGETTQQDVLKAQAEISMLKARILELEQQQAVLKAKLNQLLNRRADSPLGLAVTEPQREFEFQADQLFGLAEKNRPEIKQARAQIERSQRERDLMKKEFLPDYRLGVEYRNVGVDWSDFSRSDNMVMFTIGIDLPIWQTKYRAGVREANKMIESTQAALEAAETQTSYDVQDASFKLLTARRSLDLYASALVPQAEARFHASEAGYQTGKVDFLDLLESERFLLNARVMAVMAEGNVGMQLARLERAVGTDLKPSTDSGENGK
ncbi:MAG: TolC family protein [Verrucomicrobiia bacterium]|jgi:outer membrane protein TolC